MAQHAAPDPAPRPARPTPPASGPANVHRLEDNGHDTIVRVGQVDRIWSDFYHHALTAPWSTFFYGSLLVYVGINLLFALLYMADSNGISGTHPHSFADFFFFSVQTLSTVGYGGMIPTSHTANLIATVEVLGGMMINALATGLIFARFSRPRARVMFSDKALILHENNQLHLDIRIANCRRSPILSVDVEFALARLIRTPAGRVVRQFDPLPLQQAHVPVLRFACTPTHVIDENSPLYGMTEADLSAQEAEIIVSLTGTDEASGQTVFARSAYGFDRMLYNHRFVDIINAGPDGRITVDYTRFDQTESPQDATADVAEYLADQPD
ncbi:ATP-sensitive potassium channel protein [Komagataeibacter xylinus]|nr:K channel inward rectifier conserved region 2 domain protein [Komagataeibacter xylinus E25]RFP01290.1 ATP-sensitive potassium channel protein [Komagataeibacter xylinus]RFP05418.1 ATP-sensitive potassium channel protein [Komagataeibacter xylinus]